MKIKDLFPIVLLSIPLLAAAINANRVSLDKDWQFRLDPDTAWQAVELPHDWSVEHDFDRDCPSGNDGGYLPTGKGTYRRTLDIADTFGRTFYLYLEGAYMHSRVWVNGHVAGGHGYGYTSYRIDITPFLKDGTNTITVETDNSRQKNSRWYSGSGLYRHVWLEESPRTHIEPWSMHITTPVVSKEESVVRVQFTVLSPDSTGDTRRMPMRLTVEPGGYTIADTVEIRPGQDRRLLSYDIAMPAAQLWSPSQPALYTATVALGNGDAATERFGIRSIAWSPDGFVLNGDTILISGACVHHDNGILGAASFDDAEFRKALLLKEGGFNAVRTSHNPAAPAFLDACDELGLLVIDEAFDGWRQPKNTYDYATMLDTDWESDLGSMVLRDRNHPSVIAWSIGNEILERKTAEAVQTARMFAGKCRALDPTRPVTQALAAWDPEWDIFDALAAEHDIVGYNYMIHMAEGDHARVPARVMWQTESYPRDAFANWTKVHDLPYVVGDFVWTGIDYIGESGIGRHYYDGDVDGEHYHRPMWPWHNAVCGDIDITGARKPVSFYRQMLYASEPMIDLAVLEPDGYRGKIRETQWSTWPAYHSWNWPGHKGKPITVEVASTYPQVALYLNDRLVGTQPTGRDNQFKARFELPYTPGTLKAVALDADGQPRETRILETSGRPYAIELVEEPVRPGSQLVYVRARIVDRQGRLVPDSTNSVSFRLEGGDSTILATGSADPKDPAGYTRTTRPAAGGTVLAIVRRGASPTTLRASSPHLRSATLTL